MPEQGTTLEFTLACERPYNELLVVASHGSGVIPINLKQTDEKTRYRQYLAAELEGAGLFNTFAIVEPDAERSKLFRDLARTEMRHASRWAEKLGIPLDSLKPKYTFRTRLLGWLAKHFGFKVIAPFLVGEEVKEFDKYRNDPAAEGFDSDERQAARIFGLSSIPGAIRRQERWHRTGGGGTLRAAVLGVNDGLVSNFSLTMGVAGSTQESSFVLLAGVAGMLAGSLSMAAGEYVSMRAQLDLYEDQIRLERAEIQDMPEEEVAELTAIYRAKGLSQPEAERLARHIMSEPELAVSTKVMEEMGLPLQGLGKPWSASVSSFAAFASGAVVPILPYIFSADTIAFTVSALLSALALAAVGTVLALLSGINPLRGALRMLFVGCLAAAITYGVGRLFGVAIN